MATGCERKGRIQTVCGLMDPEDLGPTLMHEHILWDVTRPEVRWQAARDDTPPVTITLDNVWEVNRRSILDYGNQDNHDYAVALEELIRLKRDGGGAVVDLSNFGLKPDPTGLRYLSESSGVPIVQGGGTYVDEYIPEDMKRTPVDALAREFVAQITEGCWGTDVKAGIIGEMGCMWPLRPFERKALQAAALAQQETGASINVHPGRHRDAVFEIVEVVGEAGGDVTRLVMSHIDRTLFTVDDVLRLAATGCVIEYDFFGVETSYYWFADSDLPTDYMRVAYIRELFDHGHGEQIVLSHDICTKTRLSTFGGHGYGHLFRNVLPLMRRKGLTEAQVHAALVGKPAAAADVRALGSAEIANDNERDTTMAASPPLGADAAAAFARDGVVCVRGLLDDAWVARLRRAIDRVERNPGPFRERYSPGDPGAFMSEKFLWTFDADFRAVVFDSPWPRPPPGSWAHRRSTSSTTISWSRNRGPSLPPPGTRI